MHEAGSVAFPMPVLYIYGGSPEVGDADTVVFFVMHNYAFCLCVNAPLLASVCSILVVYENVTHSWQLMQVHNPAITIAAIFSQGR